MFQYGFGVVPVLHNTIIAHIPISVIGSGMPIFFTTCAEPVLFCVFRLYIIFDSTIIAYNLFSVIGKVLPKIFTTFDSENAIWLPRRLVAIFDNTIIKLALLRVNAIMLPKNFTTFVTLVRDLNLGAVLDTTIINTFISHVIPIMFPISSQVFPTTLATRIVSIYIITFQNGAIYRVVPNFKQIHSLKVGVIQIFSRALSS